MQNELQTFETMCEMYWYTKVAEIKNIINWYTDQFGNQNGTAFPLEQYFYWFDWKNIIISEKQIDHTILIARSMPYHELKKAAKRDNRFIFVDAHTQPPYTLQDITPGIDQLTGHTQVLDEKHLRKCQRLRNLVEKSSHRFIWIYIHGMSDYDDGMYMTNEIWSDIDGLQEYHCCKYGWSIPIHLYGSSHESISASTSWGPWIMIGIKDGKRYYQDHAKGDIYPYSQTKNAWDIVKKTFWNWMDSPRWDWGMYFNIDRPVIHLYFNQD